MASSLDDNIPQWKKDLILRKRAQAGAGGSAATRASSGERAQTQPAAVSCSTTAVKERCDTVKMVQDSVLVMRAPAPATNGNCCQQTANGNDSDSSEELQYGPGIVSKLKSKYLSLTLRETTVTSRPSILPLRRAASLENLLDADDASQVNTETTTNGTRRATVSESTPNRRFVTNNKTTVGVTTNSRYRPTTRGNETVKRARSVETISRERPERVNRPLRITPVLAPTERPAADHVRQARRLFEGPASRRTRAPPQTGDVAAKVASFKQIINIQSTKPPIAPKPAPQLSSVKLPPTPPPVIEPSPIPDVLDAAGSFCSTPDLIVHSSPSPPRPYSPRTLQNMTQDFLKSEISHNTEIFIPATKPTSPLITNSTIPNRSKSPDSPSPRIPPTEPPVSDDLSHEITEQAVDNIAKAGHTITYRFSDALTNKSHLPRLNTIPVRIKLVPDTASTKSPPLKVHKVNGNASPPVVASPESPKVPKLRPAPPVPPPAQKTPLTSREIEKNSINKLKTLEQPVSKVVVAMRSVDEVVAKKKQRPSEQTTILFNFQARETIPDYIASDGSTNIRRGKREKPKPGESGIILLPGAPAEEFTDEDEDWMLSLNGPPSPCDVHFVNDNILIDGRSSICKHPKRQKLRIQFDDNATQVFEYQSEASMMEDNTPATPSLTSPSPTGHTVPSLTGSSLASYTPSKMTVTAGDFQLGVTRQPAVVTTAPSCTSPAPDSLDSNTSLLTPAEHPVTYSAETNADILF